MACLPEPSALLPGRSTQGRHRLGLRERRRRRHHLSHLRRVQAWRAQHRDRLKDLSRRRVERRRQARAEAAGPRRRARYSQRRKEVSLLTLGIVLLALGAVLLVAEAHLPSFGALGIAGIAALATAVALAVDAAGGGLALFLGVALAIGVGAGALVVYAMRASLSVARARARTGAEALVGHIGVVRQAPAPFGQILVDGALWRARPCWGEEDGPGLRVGDDVVVERVNGLTLSVRRAEEWELEA